MKRKKSYYSGVRRSEGGALTNVPFNINTDSQQEETYLASPTEEILPYYYQKEDDFSPSLTTVQPMRDCHNSDKENPLYSELPISSNQLSVYNKPSQLPLLLYKKFSLLSFAKLACYLL